MNIHYYVIRHSHLLLKQNQAYVPILLMKRRKEVYPGTFVIQNQDILNNILSITQAMGYLQCTTSSSAQERKLQCTPSSTPLSSCDYVIMLP